MLHYCIVCIGNESSDHHSWIMLMGSIRQGSVTLTSLNFKKVCIELGIAYPSHEASSWYKNN